MIPVWSASKVHPESKGVSMRVCESDVCGSGVHLKYDSSLESVRSMLIDPSLEYVPKCV